MARRRLRTTIEQHGLGINEQFLAAAEAIIKVCIRLQGQPAFHMFHGFPACLLDMHASLEVAMRCSHAVTSSPSARSEDPKCHA